MLDFTMLILNKNNAKILSLQLTIVVYYSLQSYSKYILYFRIQYIVE